MKSRLFPHKPYFSNIPPKIPKQDVVKGEKIGNGSFSIVYKAIHQNKTVACKSINAKQSRGSALNELVIMQYIKDNHTPNVVHIHAYFCTSVFSTTPKYHIVMEYVDGQSLADFFKNNPGRLSFKEKIKAMLDITFAVSHLHALNVIHRDIKPANILREEKTGQIKLCDFGLAVFLPQHQQYPSVGGSPYFLAPELLIEDNLVRKNISLLKKQNIVGNTKSTDVYSLGITFWQMITEEKPYSEIDNTSQLYDHVVNGNRLQIPDTTSPEVKQVLEQSWDQNPNQRPLAEEVLEKLNAINELDQSRTNALKAKL